MSDHDTQSARADAPQPYWSSYKAGIGLGLVLLASFVVMGRGLGASGAATRMAAHAIDRVDAAVRGGTLAEGSTWVRQGAYTRPLFAANTDVFDDFLVYLFVGVILGGFASGLQSRRLSLAIIHGPHTSSRRRIFFAVLGGLVSAYGTRLARGCTSGQALSGGATLAFGSWIFMLAVFAGGYALAYFLRKEWI